MLQVNPGRRPAEQFQTEFRNDLLGGMVVLHHTGAVFERAATENAYLLYLANTTGKRRARKFRSTFIPY